MRVHVCQAPAHYYACHALPDVNTLEEMFVEMTLDLLSSLSVWSAKMLTRTLVHSETLVQPYHGGTSNTCTEDITVPQAKIQVQLNISDQTLQDILCIYPNDAHACPGLLF